MPTFDASTVVETLGYKFAPYVTAEGVTPEPTDKMIGEFLSGMKKIGKETQEAAGVGSEVDASDPLAVIQALDNLDPDVFVETLAKMSKLYADLCGGHPSATVLGKLPLRVRLRYFAWIAGEVFSPEGETGAGNVRTLPHAVAG